jgi:uncharacterized protein YndB with AHSA1/START domain
MSKTTYIIEPGKQEIIARHIFDAPRQMVFKMMMDPDLLPQWWGPKRLTTTVEKMEVKDSGAWRFVQRDASGNEFGFHGVYHSVVPFETVVQTFEFEGMPGHVILESVTYEERDGQTLLTEHSVYQSLEDRDGMVASGMQEGSTESMDRFAELLSKVAMAK